MTVPPTQAEFFKDWLNRAVIEAAKKENFVVQDDGKTIQIVERNGKAEIFYTRAPILRPQNGKIATPAYSIDAALVQPLVDQMFAHAHKPPSQSQSFVQLEILRKTVSSCGFHICINQLAPTFRIITISATLNEKEAREVTDIINNETPTHEELLEMGNKLLAQ